MHIFVYARDESSNWELILVTGFSRLGTIEIYQPVNYGDQQYPTLAMHS